MRKKHSKLLGYMIAAFALAVITSCINEDLENCAVPQGSVRISLKLDEIVQPETSLLHFGIDSVSVFVFDSDNKYVKAVHGGACTGENYDIFLDLPDGYFHFVVWTNQGGSYKTNKTIEECEAEAVSKEDLEFFLSCSPGDAVQQEIPDLLYGKMSQQIINNHVNNVVVPMTPNTYMVNVKVKGLAETDNHFEFTITDNNSHYTFDNVIVEGKDNFHHIRSCMLQEKELNVSFKTLKLMHSRSPQFVFKDATTDKTLFSNCLVQTIIKAYETAGQQVDFDKTHTFEIVLNYYKLDDKDITKLGVTVSVNGWEYTPAGETLE